MATSTAVSVEEVVKNACIDPQRLKQVCDTSDLKLKDFCDPWKFVGLALELTEEELSAIDNDYPSGYGSTDNKRSGFLRKWSEKFGPRATYYALVQALLKCKKANLALELCKHLNSQVNECKIAVNQPQLMAADHQRLPTVLVLNNESLKATRGLPSQCIKQKYVHIATYEGKTLIKKLALSSTHAHTCYAI